MAASCLSLNRRKEAEHYWLRSVKLRPSYFEAVEHLIGLLCGDHRAKEAIKIIEFVENALKYPADGNLPGSSDFANSDYGRYMQPANSMGYCDSINSRHGGYDISPQDNGRMIALIHAKGNMLYALGDNTGAAKAFEDAIMVAAGNRREGIAGLITQILRAFSPDGYLNVDSPGNQVNFESILLMPDQALETAKLVFPIHGDLPGLIAVPDGQSKKAAISTTSNSLLSLAKIYQDGMSSSGATAGSPKAASGVQDILALYYLSLSLQPSPSTANNVGILLASIQQPGPKSRISRVASQQPLIAGVVPGSGIHLALLYYNYGLNLDQRHAHLYTNLGSLLKDIGQLNAAIKMYEKAVECDGSFDIALANLANAVKDQGRISEAIEYYKRAVASSPDFAEAVCGLANALNSVCGWQGRGGVVYRNNEFDRWHVDEQGMLLRVELPHTKNSGWIGRVVAIVEKQLNDGQSWGRGVLQSIDLEEFLNRCHLVNDPQIYTQRQSDAIVSSLTQWAGQNWEGAKVVRLVERATKRLGWQLYQNRYMRRGGSCSSISYARPQLPAALATPSAPTVLPFHTFTCPLTAKQIRKISQRNGLRISCSTLRAPWLPANIFEPPSPPQPYLKVGYVSSDFNNHPLAHLMQSVFGFHNPSRVKAYCYATTASDNSVHRQQIEREAPVFHDASAWSVDRLVKQVVVDGIHILINLNGYTRGARNEVFAARPAPIQMSFMGFAGTLGSEWCDYLLADTTSIPPRTLRPYRNNIDVLDQVHDDNNGDEQEDWVYGENIIYTRDTFFCCDHRQSAPDSQEQQLKWPEEQKRRWRMRKELFPELSDDTVILGNFNQLYKVGLKDPQFGSDTNRALD
jgi:tetratricopeptide (TPR) repeat protein